MRATRTRPPGYVEAGRVVLDGNRRLIIGVNLVMVPLLGLSCAGFGALAAVVNPGLARYEVTFTAAGPALVYMGLLAGGVLLASALALVSHEAVHGAVFWFYTRSRPVFGYKGWYAYASAPGWYFSRSQMIVTGLAPLVVLSVASVVAMALVPPVFSLLLVVGATVNAAGAAGDMYIVLRLLSAPPDAVVEDTSDGIRWYVPAVGAPRQRGGDDAGLSDHGQSREVPW